MKPKAFFLLLAMARGCIGCGPAPLDETNVLSLIPAPMTVACVGCNESAMSAAIEFWNKGTGVRLFAELDASGASPFVTITAVDEVPGTDEAYTKLYPNHCTIDVERATMHRPWLISHELGHCAGFDHSTNPRSIMAKNTHPDSEITQEISEIVLDLVEGSQI